MSKLFNFILFLLVVVFNINVFSQNIIYYPSGTVIKIENGVSIGSDIRDADNNPISNPGGTVPLSDLRLIAPVNNDGTSITNVTVTNNRPPIIKFSPGNSIRIDHAAQSIPGSLDKESIITVSADGQNFSNLTFRGEWKNDAVYFLNDVVRVPTITDIDSIIPGITYFVDTFVAVSNNFSGEDKLPDLQRPGFYWNPLVTRGATGPSGPGNLNFDPNVWTRRPFSSNVVISFVGELYVSLTNIVGSNINIEPGGEGSSPLWKKIVNRGLDGRDGAVTREIIYLQPTNQIVQGLNFKGIFNAQASSYASNDVVVYGAISDKKTYYALQNIIRPSESQQLPEPPQDPRWAIFIDSGVASVATFSNLIYRGEYDSLATYFKNNAVTFDGNLFAVRPSLPANTIVVGIQPPQQQQLATTNANFHWEVVVRRGVDGLNGITSTLYGRYNIERAYPVNALVITGEGVFRVKDTAPDGFAPPGANPQLQGVFSSPYWEIVIRSGIDGKDGIGLSWQGNWNQSRVVGYEKDAVVYYRPSNDVGGLWVCNIDHTESPAGSFPPGNQSIVWSRVLRDGVSGTTIGGFVYKGEYQIGEPYTTNDLVVDNNRERLYKPRINFTPEIANTLNPLTGGLWELILSAPRGQPGSQGPIGNTGPRGEQGVPGVGNLVFRGFYTNNITYTTNDAVRYTNSILGGIFTVTPAAGTRINIDPVQTNGNIGAGWRVVILDGFSGSNGVNGVGNMFFAGPFVSGSTYTTNQFVIYSNALYVLTNNVNFNSNIHLPIETDYWIKLIEGLKGDTGISITNASLQALPGSSDRNLILNLSNNTNINVGNVRGERGEVGPAGASLALRGPYATNITYNPSNLVTFSGSTYYSIFNTPFSNVPPTEPTHWSLFIERGDIGPTGLRGPQGLQGFDGINLVPKGNWLSTTNYTTNDVVTFGGTAYQSLINNNSNSLPSVTNPNWRVFVSSGATLIPRGEWTQGFYNTNEIVTFQNNTYYSLIPNNNLSPTNPAGWQLFVGQGAQGIPGGVMVPKGTWAATNAYDLYDIVISQGSAYYSLTNNNIGNSPIANTNQWSIFTQRGPAGTTNLFFQGSFSEELSYGVNALVEFEGSTFRSLENSNNSTPTNPAAWELFVQRGRAATIQVNAVSNVPFSRGLSITNIGTENEALFNFNIPADNMLVDNPDVYSNAFSSVVTLSRTQFPVQYIQVTNNITINIQNSDPSVDSTLTLRLDHKEGEVTFSTTNVTYYRVSIVTNKLNTIIYDSPFSRTNWSAYQLEPVP